MHKKLNNIVLLVMTGAVLLGFTAAGWFGKPAAYSMTERRTLAQFPAAAKEQVLSGKFMTEFETYSLDQFPLRDRLREWKAVVARKVFGQKDDHGFYVVNGNLSKLEYPMQEEKVKRSAAKLQEIQQKFLEGTDCKVYLSVIPDKNYFLAPIGGYPTMDYLGLVKLMREKLDFASYIDVFPELSLEQYYLTDQHWKQESIRNIADVIADGMGKEIGCEFEEKTLDNPFYGAYYGQAALKLKPDSLHYLTNEILENCTVTSYNTGKPAPSTMYDMKKAAGRDPYEMYLSGSDPLLIIENPDPSASGELVIFRDSFGSSLVPLLVPAYSKITLVDMRYMNSGILGSFIDFDKQDVLFMYSTLVLNSTIAR